MWRAGGAKQKRCPCSSGRSLIVQPLEHTAVQQYKCSDTTSTTSNRSRLLYCSEVRHLCKLNKLELLQVSHQTHVPEWHAPFAFKNRRHDPGCVYGTSTAEYGYLKA